MLVQWITYLVDLAEENVRKSVYIMTSESSNVGFWWNANLNDRIKFQPFFWYGIPLRILMITEMERLYAPRLDTTSDFHTVWNLLVYLASL